MNRRRLALVIGLLASVAACDAANVIRPANALTVSNAQNLFGFQVHDLAGVTQTLTYNWLNAGDSATVTQAVSLTGGSATLTVRGPDGAQVYQSALDKNGTFKTMKSVIGTWQIEVSFIDAEGTVGFGVKKAP